MEFSVCSCILIDNISICFLFDLEMGLGEFCTYGLNWMIIGAQIMANVNVSLRQNSSDHLTSSLFTRGERSQRSTHCYRTQISCRELDQRI